MRNGEGQIEKKRASFVFAHEIERVISHQVVSVVFTDELFAAFVSFKHFLGRVAPKMIGIVVMGLALAKIAVEIIEALLVWFSGASRPAKSPFPDASGFVTDLLQEVSERESTRGNGPLAFCR